MAKKETAGHTGLNLILALNYSGKWDLEQAVQKLVKDQSEGKLTADTIDQELISTYLSTNGVPDPELMVRTSGEMRISNFLLWQMAYTELYFTDVLWPDFRKEHLREAINVYKKRERRFGKTSEQITVS